VIVDRQVLAEALKQNRTLKRLNLANRGLGVEGVQARRSDWAGWCLSKDRAGGVDLIQLAYSSCFGQRLRIAAGS